MPGVGVVGGLGLGRVRFGGGVCVCVGVLLSVVRCFSFFPFCGCTAFSEGRACSFLRSVFDFPQGWQRLATNAPALRCQFRAFRGLTLILDPLDIWLKPLRPWTAFREAWHECANHVQ